MQATGGVGSYETKKASHAGSWYTALKDKLEGELS